MLRTAGLALALTLLAGAAGAQGLPTGGPDVVRVRYIVNDVGDTIAFYRDKLGFKVDFQSGSFFAALSKGGVQLLISPVKGPGGASRAMPDGRRPAPGGWTRLVLNTPNLQAKVDDLRRQGVHFRNDIVVGLGGSEILLDDPSGNPVELFQPG